MLSVTEGESIDADHIRSDMRILTAELSSELFEFTEVMSLETESSVVEESLHFIDRTQVGVEVF